MRCPVPVALQARAVAFGIVDVQSQCEVRPSACGFALYPGRRYRLRVSLGEATATAEPSLSGTGSIRCEHALPLATTDDACPTRSLDFHVPDDSARAWGLLGLLSHVESLVLRVKYPDGRDDFESAVRVVVTPRRSWLFWIVLSLAVLYGLLPALFKTAVGTPRGLDQWLECLRPLAEPWVWITLFSGTIGLWVLLIGVDRIRNYGAWSQWRRQYAIEIAGWVRTVDSD